MSLPQPTKADRKARILIVEDDAEIRTLLQRLLAKNYAVVAAADGRQGLILAKKVNPDLLLLDVMLPEIDGFDLAEAIRSEQRLKKVPIVFLTARDTAKDTIKGIQAGARHYLTKPFNIQDVLQKIEKILR